MKKSSLLFVILIISGLFYFGGSAHAGFGISPPFVRTKNPVFPGSRFEQRITLLRSSAEEALQANLTVQAPEIESWISFDKGLSFVLPAGELQVPMVVTINVPSDAEIGHYTGNFSVQISPSGNTSGGVAIALGARGDIDLEVSNEAFIDFLVRQVKIPQIETLKAPWKWPPFSWFFYRLKVAMTIENIGNVAVAPSQVQLDIYDLNEKNMLETHTDKKIKKVDPLQSATVEATFPTKLPPGEYWGRTRVYKGNDIIHKDKLIFTIYPAGQLPGGTQLGKWPYIMLGVMILILLIFIYILIKIRIWRYIFKLILIISWPLRYIWHKLLIGAGKLNVIFWRWIHRKSAKYSQPEAKIEKTETSDDED